jgi:hypothetical protein
MRPSSLAPFGTETSAFSHLVAAVRSMPLFWQLFASARDRKSFPLKSLRADRIGSSSVEHLGPVDNAESGPSKPRRGKIIFCVPG